jgi:thimet oligopeptidase
MLEDWVYDKKVLKLFAEVCPACRPVPDAMIDQARVARDFGKGVQTARQLLYATYDQALYTTDTPDPMALWSRMEGATPLGYVASTQFPGRLRPHRGRLCGRLLRLSVQPGRRPRPAHGIQGRPP